MTHAEKQPVYKFSHSSKKLAHSQMSTREIAFELIPGRHGNYITAIGGIFFHSLIRGSKKLQLQT